MVELRLEVRDFESPARWRWVLTRAKGAFLADHEVKLDERCWQFEAFADLLRYLTWHVAPDWSAGDADPDRFARDEARIVADLGEWIGSQVLGPVAGALVRTRPATVRVVVQPEAQVLLFRPLELAHVGGRPISVQGVTLVMELSDSGDGVAGGPDGRASRVGERLRVLGLFSLPEGGQPLNLRRERYSLVQLIGGIAAEGRAADVRVLQYGVTRERLRDVLTEAEGWDVIHISGHGAPGELLLEDAAGRPDTVTAADLANLLELARERVSLVTVAACWSAALTAVEQRRLLGLPMPDQRATAPAVPAGDRADAEGVGFAPEALATELAGRLGCAVLAMRYPVGDDFAIALTGKLYELLAAKGQPLPQAVGIALRELMADPAGGGWPALSVATPALFGGRAVDLRLAAPVRVQPEDYSTEPLKLAGFPPQPERFVGRTGVMARASAALAAGSVIPGVLLHGMPGGGKTACALELAYTHEHAFDRLVWFKAPDEGQDIRAALSDFALTLEAELPGFQMVHVLADERRLASFLPRLTELAEQRRVLIVVDNIESLLTEGGQWRDDRWGKVIAALSGHKGRGRLILTSRRIPASGTGGLGVAAVDALSADEALLLARELPHLNTLISGGLPGAGRDVSRRLALGVLTIAQGHPKLLELADGQAADPERLAVLVAAGDQAWRDQGGLPDGFFTPEGQPTAGQPTAGQPTAGQPAAGQATASDADYLHVLGTWTRTVTEGLPPVEQTLFWFLCCLEEPDRERFVLDGNWAALWARLAMGGQPPGLDEALAAVAARGLIAVRGEAADARESYAIHPGVAAAGRAQAGEGFRDAVDAEATACWDTVFRYASGETGDRGTDTRLMVRAGLAAVPYLMRRQQWTAAAYMVERAFINDPSRANAAAVLSAIQEIAARNPDPAMAGVLGLVLEVLDPAAGERQMRAYLDAAVAGGDYRGASVTAGRLVDLCLDGGRLAEALTVVEQLIGYTRQAGLGPWSQLTDEGRRLQVLNEMGHADRVLAEVQRLRDRMQDLPAAPGPDETAIPWNVGETLLGTGRDAALQLGRWQDALDLNAAQTTSMRGRSAPAADIARSRFNDYGPLLRLGRAEEALAVLLECRHAFQDARDAGMLGKTLGALAAIEDARGRGDAAVGLEGDALRYKYLAGDVISIAVSYHNLGYYLCRHARQPVQALACHLAAALIRAVTGAEGADGSVRAAAIDLRSFTAEDAGGPSRVAASGSDEPTPDAVPPTDVPALCRLVGDIPGTDLPGLIAALAADPATADQTLRDLTAQAQDQAAAAPETAPTPPA
ncbi:MAG TPA: CHAT domain-containing protein [Trebonia sp.]|nr:CHAT domain-containing protein [Trebonia sp.]